MGKKAIVFDLDDTLRKLEYNSGYKKIINVNLRPNIIELLENLKKAKEEGTDILIWTTASTESANRYFIDYLPEEYRDLFNEIIAGDNKIDVKEDSIEEEVYMYNISNKPVTALENYDQILFFDDNRVEGYLLKKLYEDENTSPDKQVVFARYYYFPISPSEIYALKKLSEENEGIAIKVNEFFTKLLEEPGCRLMVEKIEEFQKSSYSKGLISDTENEILEKYYSEISNLDSEIGNIIWDNELSEKFRSYMNEYYSKVDSKNTSTKKDVNDGKDEL